jgi:hypothetical protein
MLARVSDDWFLHGPGLYYVERRGVLQILILGSCGAYPDYSMFFVTLCMPDALLNRCDSSTVFAASAGLYAWLLDLWLERRS